MEGIQVDKNKYACAWERTISRRPIKVRCIKVDYSYKEDEVQLNCGNGCDKRIALYYRVNDNDKG